MLFRQDVAQELERPRPNRRLAKGDAIPGSRDFLVRVLGTQQTEDSLSRELDALFEDLREESEAD